MAFIGMKGLFVCNFFLFLNTHIHTFYYVDAVSADEKRRKIMDILLGSNGISLIYLLMNENV